MKAAAAMMSILAVAGTFSKLNVQMSSEQDEWEKALAFKERACRDYAKRGLSSVTKKYLPKRKRS